MQHNSQLNDTEKQADTVAGTDTQKQIRALMRQITASVTFLPELDDGDNYTFNVLAYTDANAKVPLEWADSDSMNIENGEKVEFRSFSTSDHEVRTHVSYKINS